MMECPPGKLVLTWAEFAATIHPEDLPSLEAAGTPANANAETVQHEFRLLLPSGAIRWMRSQWRFEFTNGTPIGSNRSYDRHHRGKRRCWPSPRRRVRQPRQQPGPPARLKNWNKTGRPFWNWLRRIKLSIKFSQPWPSRSLVTFPDLCARSGSSWGTVHIFPCVHGQPNAWQVFSIVWRSPASIRLCRQNPFEIFPPARSGSSSLKPAGTFRFSIIVLYRSFATRA